MTNNTCWNIYVVLFALLMLDSGCWDVVMLHHKLFVFLIKRLAAVETYLIPEQTAAVEISNNYYACDLTLLLLWANLHGYSSCLYLQKAVEKKKKHSYAYLRMLMLNILYTINTFNIVCLFCMIVYWTKI